MDRRIINVLLGVAGIVFWFAPLTSFTIGGMWAYQAGHHIGGIAYLLLLAYAAFAVLAWLKNYDLMIIASAIALLLCIVLLLMAGAQASWGLYILIVLSAIGLYIAVIERVQRAR